METKQCDNDAVCRMEQKAIDEMYRLHHADKMLKLQEEIEKILCLK